MTTHEDRWSQHREISGGVLALDAEDLVRLLPLSKKRILIDRVLSLQPGRHAVAQKAVTAGDVATPGRKSGFVFPSTSALIALEQVSMVILLSASEPKSTLASAWCHQPTSIYPSLVEVETLDVVQEMTVPGLLHLRASKVSESSETMKFEGGVSVGGEEFITAHWWMGIIES
ncbi:MAG TPA: hypothetical protein EYQ08_08970 [Planctomycetes bacterium]|nr:hypothetical protein [Planctomycetota bacterium]HIK83161.1 hypothetical protein [Planctomycetota bacterium]